MTGAMGELKQQGNWRSPWALEQSLCLHEEARLGGRGRGDLLGTHNNKTSRR